MDHARFDALTRVLATGATRRAGLKAGLGGLLGAGIAALAEAGDAEAKKKRKKKRAKTECSAEKPCPDGQSCLDLWDSLHCICDSNGSRPCGGVCCGDWDTCVDDVCRS